MKKIFTFIMIVTAFAAYGQSVGLDPTFGEDGIVSFSGILDIYDIALDQKENIFVVGIDSSYKAILMKFSADGLIDKTFGNNGIVRPDDETRLPFPRILILSNGKILLSGSFRGHGATVLRYHSNGVLDENFATNGILSIDEALSSIELMRLLEDDTVLIAGISYIIKINSDGEIDRQFGNNGLLRLNIPNFDFSMKDFAPLPDNNLLCVGHEQEWNGDDNYSVCCKIDKNGNFIKDFGEEGIVRINMSYDNMPGAEFFYQIKILNDKEVFVAGKEHSTIVCLKMDPTYGIIDSNFGDNGFFLWDDFLFLDIEIQEDEKILIGKISKAPFTVVRLTSDGDFDDTFYNQGIAEVSFPFKATLYRMAIQNRNKLILGSLTDFGMALARIDLGEINAIDDEGFPENLTMYPNPTTGRLTIAVGTQDFAPVKIKLFDIFGRKVLETNETAFDIEHLSAGIYFVQIEMSDRVITKKIIKQ